MSLLIPDDADPFRFAGSVGRHGDNDRADVIKAQQLLSQAGYLDLPDPGMPTGWPGDGLTRAITRLQRDSGLTPDGILLPLRSGGVGEHGEGETLHALKDRWGDHLDRLSALTPQQVDHYWQTKPGRDGETRLAQADGASPAVLPKSKPMPVPDHKASLFDLPGNRNAWADSQSAIQRQLADQPTQRTVMGRIYAEEGGRLRDPTDTAVGGITAPVLKELQDRDCSPACPGMHGRRT